MLLLDLSHCVFFSSFKIYFLFIIIIIIIIYL